jgi:lipoprotein-releasing system permease protein
MWQAPRIARELSKGLSSDFRVQDWTQTQGTLFASITMEKRMVGLLLFLVVIVAAFNLIATLAMSVHSRRRDIAVLGMMGLSRWSVGQIFVFQGVLMSGVAIALGLLLGTVVATFLPSIVVFIETALNFHLFDPSVYFITKLPSDIKVADLLWVGLSALFLSGLASLYPALRASRILPAEVLRYE